MSRIKKCFAHCRSYSTHTSSFRVAFGAIAVTWTAVIVVGCSPRVQPPVVLPTEQTAAAVVFDGLDTSKSDREELPGHLEETGKLDLSVDPDSTWITVFRFDAEPREIFSGTAPPSAEALLEDLATKCTPLIGRDFTYLDLVFAPIARRAAKCTGRCVVIVATDGACEGMTPSMHASLTRSAEALAANSHVLAVFIEGVHPEYMATMRSDLAPLGQKIQFVSNGALDTNLIGDLLRSGEVRK